MSHSGGHFSRGGVGGVTGGAFWLKATMRNIERKENLSPYYPRGGRCTSEYDQGGTPAGEA